jgi:hypothetical protein
VGRLTADAVCDGLKMNVILFEVAVLLTIFGAGAGMTKALPPLECGRNGTPVLIGCSEKPVYKAPVCSPVIICGLVVEESVPVTVVTPVPPVRV